MENIKAEASKNIDFILSESEIKRIISSIEGANSLGDIMDQLNLSGYLIRISPGYYKWRQ